MEAIQQSARSLAAQQKFAEAAALLQDAVTEAADSDPRGCAILLFEQALYALTGRTAGVEEVEKLCRRALVQCTEVLGENNIFTEKSKSQLAVALIYQHKYPDAVDLLRQVTEKRVQSRIRA